MQSTLDKEWVYLMVIAREIGVTKEQVKDFIDQQKNKEEFTETRQ